MKKFLFLFIALSIGLSCKKPLCGCSPVEYNFALSVRDTSNKDLLAPDAPGGYTISQIKLYYKDGGNLRQVDSYIRPPFNYFTEKMETLKFEYYHIQSPNLVQLRISGKTEFYIRFGENEALPLSFDIDRNYNSATNVKIGNEPLHEDLAASGYPSVWVLTIPAAPTNNILF